MKLFLAYQMQNFLTLADGITPTPRIMYTYTFRLKQDLKLSIFWSQNAKFS